MAIGMHISIITSNVNGLNAPTKRHRLAEWIQKQDPYIYAVYKRPTSDLKTHIDWKWEDGKIYSMQIGSIRKLEQHPPSEWENSKCNNWQRINFQNI